MRRTIAYILLLLFLNAPFVRMAPATPGAGPDTSVSLVQLNNLAPISASTASKFVDLPLQQLNEKQWDLTSP